MGVCSTNEDEPSAAELREAVVRCYPRLRGLMQQTLHRHDHGNTQSLTNPPTALTNELVERLIQQRKSPKNDEHMMALAGMLAERVVLDDLKRRNRAMRGHGYRGGTLPQNLAEPEPEYSFDGEGVRAVLSRFNEEHPREAEVASLCLMFGLTMPEIAEAVGVSLTTAERDWRFARAWLAEALGDNSLETGTQTHDRT